MTAQATGDDPVDTPANASRSRTGASAAATLDRRARHHGEAGRCRAGGLRLRRRHRRVHGQVIGGILGRPIDPSDASPS
jgi:hypothetical protein